MSHHVTWYHIIPLFSLSTALCRSRSIIPYDPIRTRQPCPALADPALSCPAVRRTVSCPSDLPCLALPCLALPKTNSLEMGETINTARASLGLFSLTRLAMIYAWYILTTSCFGPYYSFNNFDVYVDVDTVLLAYIYIEFPLRSDRNRKPRLL